MNGKDPGEHIIIKLSGRIDSTNAARTEERILSQFSLSGAKSAELDASELDYISSAGLRVILRLKKICPDLSITGVSPEVYGILEVTGFTEILKVEKAYRVVSIEGCEEIGHGANGSIYRIDSESVVKVYKNDDALNEIRHEREVARTAFILGIPTAIPYDVVRVGNSYGSVFELLNARSFSKILSTEPDKFDWCVSEFVKLLKKIHSTSVPHGKLPNMKQTVLDYAAFHKDLLPEQTHAKLISLFKAVPDDDHMLHGDYHTNNLQLNDNEVLIIDMDTLSVGRPIFEFGPIFNAFIGFAELDHSVVLNFHGIDFDTACRFFHEALSAYLGTKCPAKLREVEDKARIIAYSRLISRAVRHGQLSTDQGRRELEYRRSKLIELVEKTDRLDFDPNELVIDALTENLPEVQTFIEEKLETVGCPMKTGMQIALAVEEIFVNIASYAYAPGVGKVSVLVELSDAPSAVTITFSDSGIPYDPLKADDPDTALSADERPIGGLGVYLTKRSMDSVSYEYRDGMNVFSMTKNL